MLAERVMRWRVGPDRFSWGKREWLPTWKFQPTRQIADAFRILELLGPEEYTFGAKEDHHFWAEVRVGDINASACEDTMALAICVAVARALGIDCQGVE
jgi:hypothetical protein